MNKLLSRYSISTLIIFNLIIFTQSIILADNGSPTLNTNLQDLQNEIIGLNKEIELLKKENSELKKTIIEITEPEKQFDMAIDALNKNDYEKAKQILSNLISDYPNSKYIQESKKKLSYANEKIKENTNKQEEKQKTITKGFDNIKTHTSIKTDNTKLDIKKVTKSKKWITDWHDNEYLYEDADKNSDFFTIDFNVTSKQNNPRLPGLYIAEISEDGKLRKIKSFDVAFHGWSNYGAYLGNYHDSKNDFAKKDTIRFSAGAQMDKGNRKKIIFASQNECYLRIERDLPPAATYSKYSCPEIESPLTIEDFIDNYQAIKIIK